MNYISGYASSTDTLVQFGLWASIGAVSITLGLILYIVIFRLHQLSRQARLARFQAQWRPILAMCSFTIPAELPQLSAHNHMNMLSLWNHYYNIIHGDARGNLLVLAEQLDLAHIARLQLFHHDKLHQLLGILCLGNLASREDWPLLNRFIQLPDTNTSLVALRALFQINPQRALHTLLPYLISRTDYPTAQVATLLYRIPAQDSCPQLTMHMMLNLGKNSSHILRLLEACGCNITRQVFKAILDKAPDDHIISTSLSLISDPKALDLIVPFAEYQRWHIRVHAATTLGRLGQRQHLPVLLKLLADREWWVRYRAAQAITCLPFLAAGELHALHDNLHDRFAQEMLQQTMAEQGL